MLLLKVYKGVSISSSLVNCKGQHVALVLNLLLSFVLHIVLVLLVIILFLPAVVLGLGLTSIQPCCSSPRSIMLL
jgi:hypothetical protein